MSESQGERGDEKRAVELEATGLGEKSKTAGTGLILSTATEATTVSLQEKAKNILQAASEAYIAAGGVDSVSLSADTGVSTGVSTIVQFSDNKANSSNTGSTPVERNSTRSNRGKRKKARNRKK